MKKKIHGERKNLDKKNIEKNNIHKKPQNIHKKQKIHEKKNSWQWMKSESDKNKRLTLIDIIVFIKIEHFTLYL